ncbi:putative orfan [Tupanvirus soda lake]|uniref:Orfan n=2 Tax=Tupanvirus TaxID=2094720 RepID=A0AC62ABR9_9VIRU|nr:putative orfan [Tupanvirus soda lake]QKU35184.1 putative orfan [Tupanvirus soda lake]
MDNAKGQTNQFIFYIIAIAVLAFIFYIWLKQPSMQYYPPPNYHIYYNTHNDNKQHFEVLKNEDNDDINTESIALGGHNSAHNSAIIASPYNPPKKSKPKNSEPMPKYLSPYYQLHKKTIYPSIPQQRRMEYYYV